MAAARRSTIVDSAAGSQPPLRDVSSSPIPIAAQNVWLRFVAQEISGSPGDFDALCARHPELAPELRLQRAEWLASAAGTTSVESVVEPGVEELLARLAQPALRRSR